eukprot:9470711-Pyramimonas_sp.AAC.1
MIPQPVNTSGAEKAAVVAPLESEADIDGEITEVYGDAAHIISDCEPADDDSLAAWAAWSEDAQPAYPGQHRDALRQEKKKQKSVAVEQTKPDLDDQTAKAIRESMRIAKEAEEANAKLEADLLEATKRSLSGERHDGPIDRSTAPSTAQGRLNLKAASEGRLRGPPSTACRERWPRRTRSSPARARG